MIRVWLSLLLTICAMPCVNAAGERVRTQTQIVAVTGPSGKVETVQASVIADAGTATGTVTFSDGSAPLSTVSLNNLGTGFFYTVALDPGTHFITASYPGTASYAPSTSMPLTLQIGPSSSTTEIVSLEPRPALYGQPVTVRVRVLSSPTPTTGAISIRDGAAVIATGIPDPSGQATAVLPLLPAGSHLITATYAGNSLTAASTSAPIGLAVSKAYTTATVAASPTTVMRGQSVTLSVRVETATGSPTGSVSFKADGAALATIGLIGQRSSAIVSFDSDGQKNIGASYSGDANFESSGAITTVRVATPVVTIRASAPSIQTTETLTLTAEVTGAAGLLRGAAIDWFDSGTQIGSTPADAAGLASLVLKSLDEGQHTFSAAYSIPGATPVRSAAVSVLVAGPVPGRFVTLSAASGQNLIAPDSIASAFGVGLCAGVFQAQSLPLPLELGGATLRIEDSAGHSWSVPLSYVSPTQVNFVVPASVAAGPAKLTLTSAAKTFVSTVQLASPAPALFTADGSGTGAPQAVIVTAHADGTGDSRLAFTCGDGACTTNPINLGNASDRLVLVLYGTGIRRADIKDVSIRIGKADATVLFAGAQNEFPGLDQVNVALPVSLVGAGEVTLELTAAGRTANAVKLRFE